jgi:elongator complex protein 1
MLTSANADMEVPGDTPEADERCRCIERGGRLITVMPSTFAVTLQMPRGNIETIYPRALVLAGIRYFINAKDYRSAFLTCRSQMVDMNILHDYAPDQFMADVPLFIDQVQKVEFIDEFLSRLMYKKTPGLAETC